MKIYVASSWRNEHQPAVVGMKGAGKKVFVFQPIKQKPELMYKIYDGIIISVDGLHQQFGARAVAGN